MEQSKSITTCGTTTQEGLRESVILPYPCVLLPHSPLLPTILSLSPGSSTFPLLEISPKQINMFKALLTRTSPPSFPSNPSHSFHSLLTKFLGVITHNIHILSHYYSIPAFMVTNHHFDKTASLEPDAQLECQIRILPAVLK